MNTKQIVVLLATFLVVGMAFCTVFAEESDADIGMKSVESTGFTTSTGGTLKVPVYNDESRLVDVSLIVTNADTNEIYKTVPATIPANSTEIVNVTFTIPTTGSYNIMVTLHTDDDVEVQGSVATILIEVNKSIWSEWTTYGAIAVIIILIAIGIGLKLRNAPLTKPKTTFTEIENDRVSGKNSMPEKPKEVSVERKQYKSSKATEEVAQPVQPVAPKATANPSKAKTFTELAKEKPAKSSDEPKKLKYVSSRRK